MGILALSRKLAIWQATLFFVATLGLTLTLWPITRVGIEHRLLRLPLLGLIIFSWPVFCASIGRRLHWSPRTCYLVSGGLWAAAGIGLIVMESNTSSWGAGTGASVFTGYLCKKLVYPELGWTEPDNREEFITIFSGHKQ